MGIDWEEILDSYDDDLSDAYEDALWDGDDGCEDWDDYSEDRSSNAEDWEFLEQVMAESDRTDEAMEAWN